MRKEERREYNRKYYESHKNEIKEQRKNIMRLIKKK